MRSRSLVLLSASIALIALSGCGSAADPAGSTPSTSPSGPTGKITVFAAASLTEAFRTIGDDFEQANPGTEITFSFGPSSGLAKQIIDGNPADVFASASKANMDQVVEAKAAGTPVTFTRNKLQIAVPADNPGRVTQLSDLARPDVTVAECQPQVPCGKLATTVFANAKLTVRPATLEVDVKGVLTKVTSGDVDAGLVYVSDVKGAGDKVKGIDIPEAVNASTAYPAAALTEAANPVLAQVFVAYLTTPEAQRVLTGDGFASAQ